MWNFVYLWAVPIITIFLRVIPTEKIGKNIFLRAFFNYGGVSLFGLFDIICFAKIHNNTQTSQSQKRNNNLVTIMMLKTFTPIKKKSKLYLIYMF